MFEWPRAEGGGIISSLPFKIFWGARIPLAFVIGFFMLLISKGEKRSWKTSFLLKPKASGHQPGHNAPGFGSSQLASNPKTPSGNAQGGAVAGLQPGTPPLEPAGKDKPIVQKLCRQSRSRSRKQATDIESALVDP
jgi:hypothetical protein